tara:strand:- start:91 stop:624 length:534 start_codon:yes stop_codon:yes gene_type:complete
MSCVYIISCKDETVPEIYIGSTCNYKKRQSEHKRNCNNPNSHCHNIKLYRFIRSKGGFANFKFKVIIECGEYNKLAIEKMYIDLFNPELNTYKYNFDMKEYRENNKEKIAEQMKEYCKKNKDKITEYNKEIIGCRACRCEITKVNFKRHCLTKKHIANETKPINDSCAAGIGNQGVD